MRCDIVAKLSPITASLNGVPDPLAPSRNWTRNGITTIHAFPAATHSPPSVRYLPHRINPLRSFLRKGAPPSSAKKSIDSRAFLLHLLLTETTFFGLHGAIAWLAFSYTTTADLFMIPCLVFKPSGSKARHSIVRQRLSTPVFVIRPLVSPPRLHSLGASPSAARRPLRSSPFFRAARPISDELRLWLYSCVPRPAFQD